VGARLRCRPQLSRQGDLQELPDRALVLAHRAQSGTDNATRLNNTGVDFGAWESEPVWRSPRQCVGNLRKSFTGTLGNPRIGEPGRRLLADLLLQLSDGQIQDIFATARVDRREQKIHTPQGDRLVTFDDWVRVFKRKRDEIVNQRCAVEALPAGP